LRLAAGRLLVAGTPVRDLLLCAKHLFVAAITARHGLQVVTRRARLARLQPRGLARNLRRRAPREWSSRKRHVAAPQPALARSGRVTSSCCCRRRSIASAKLGRVLGPPGPSSHGPAGGAVPVSSGIHPRVAP
jgi:hypothetical protein